jgi:phospholipid/cholesterol/gamma-HCH transport system substrate-binding protein
MVGVVVLGALLILAWMLIQFGGKMMLPFSPANDRVRFIADRADGISNGSQVTYRGVSVGRVETVKRTPDQLRVQIDALMDREPPLPGNIKAVIRSQGLVGGGASIVLELTGPAPEGTLKTNQEIETRFIGLDILPPEFAELATELRLAAKQFRETNLPQHLDTQVEKVGKLLDSMQEIIDDDSMRKDLKQSLANIRTTTEKADRIATSLEKLSVDASGAISDVRTTVGKTQEQILSLSKQMSGRLEQTSKLLDQFQAIAEKVNKGQGTAGQLVNDPRLYESLVDTARQLNATVSDLKRLVEQWEQEGVSLKLK